MTTASGRSLHRLVRWLVWHQGQSLESNALSSEVRQAYHPIGKSASFKTNGSSSTGSSNKMILPSWVRASPLRNRQPRKRAALKAPSSPISDALGCYAARTRGAAARACFSELFITNSLSGPWPAAKPARSSLASFSCFKNGSQQSRLVGPFHLLRMGAEQCISANLKLLDFTANCDQSRILLRRD